MPSYIISYDAPAGTNYQPFYDAIAEQDAAHLSLSVWLISSSSSAPQVRDWVSGLLGSGTSVAVVQIDGDWAIYAVSPQAQNWLESHLWRLI